VALSDEFLVTSADLLRKLSSRDPHHRSDNPGPLSMSSLADLPELVGFFGYAREDDEAYEGALSSLRDRIQRELRAQLGRSMRDFRIWQDKEGIRPGALWETEIKLAVSQSVFFIPIITPSAVSSFWLQAELESFIAREKHLGRDDLIFPILYITVPDLQDEQRWRSSPVLQIIASRQYLDCRHLRHLEINSSEVSFTIEKFCARIAEHLRREIGQSAQPARRLGPGTHLAETVRASPVSTGPDRVEENRRDSAARRRVPSTTRDEILPLADLPQLTGFFSYSPQDDEDSTGALLALRSSIQRELRGQLGRSATTLRLWQDREAIADGKTRRSQIEGAMEEAVFFIPIITPSFARSPSCRFEVESFLAREQVLGRNDLIFPILYIRVPLLEDNTVRERDPVFSVIGGRQYVDWQPLRHRSADSTEVKKQVAEFCEHIVAVLRSRSLKHSDRMDPKLDKGVQSKQERSKPRESEEPADKLEQAATTPHTSDDSKRAEKPLTVGADSAGDKEFPRTRPEYWLHRVAVERKLTPGDQPLVLISFASTDQQWVDDLRDYLDAKMELLRDKHGQPYHLWNYTDAKRGTRVGDEFPEIVAEKMWRCQAAILVFSRSYFRSDYCRQIELPFLLWRRDHHNLLCLPIKIGTPPHEKVQVPSYQSVSRFVVLNELVDDRQAAEKFTESQYRSRDLGWLRQEGKEWDIEQRLAGVARHISEFLKDTGSAVEVG
jgi:hypothetical protein